LPSVGGIETNIIFIFSSLDDCQIFAVVAEGQSYRKEQQGRLEAREEGGKEGRREGGNGG
jgi:hypothetical protein